MILKAQDVLVALKLVAWGGRQAWTFQRLAGELSISQSEAHAAVRRGVAAGLLREESAAGVVPNAQALEEFVIHGLRYVYPAERGAPCLGVPTGTAAPSLAPRFDRNADMSGLSPVWPSAQGTQQGFALSPLYPSAPVAAARDAVLYELLALVDVIRDGTAAERALAASLFKIRLGASESNVEQLPYAMRGPAGNSPASSLHAPLADYAIRPPGDKLRVSQSKLAAICRKYGIAKVSLFGSASRNELKPESDVDLMLDFLPDSEASLFDMESMQKEFSAALGGRRVDLATQEVLANPYRRKSILPDLKTLYVAPTA